MLDLLIVNPAAAHGIYGELGGKLIAVEPPQWCRIIASYVRKRGFSVKIIDAEALQWSAVEVGMEAVLRHKPRLICVAVYGHQPSASTQQMFGAHEVCEVLAEEADCPVIMVGGHPSALPERTLREEPVDYVCKGEGPVTIVELLKVLKSDKVGFVGDTVPGLVWWAGAEDEQRIVVNKQAPLLDIDELDGDAWDLLPMQLYRAHNWQCFGDPDNRQPYASIYTSLGCPYSCSFCCINAPFDSHRYRMRKPEAVVAEIKMLHDEYGVRTFKITDEMFVLNPRHYGAIAEGIIDAGLGDQLNIWAYSRSDTIRPDKLALLRRAGVRWLALGIESASARVLGDVDKRLKAHETVKVVEAIQKAGINVIGNFIVGLPQDDEQSMQETLDLAKSLHLDFMNIYAAQAYPGSPLHDEAVAKGWALPSSWRGYSQHNKWARPLDTLHVSGVEVLRFRDHFFNDFYRDQRYIDRVWQKFGVETREHVKQMTQYQLDRLLLDPSYPREELEVRHEPKTGAAADPH